MRKILIIITSLIILLGMYIYFFMLSEKNNWEISYNTGSIETTLTYAEIKEKMNIENERNGELYNTAIKDGNLSLCDGLSSENKKTECRDNIQIGIYQKSGNIESCNVLSSSGAITLCRDNITSDTAIIKGDKKLCSTITNPTTREYCTSTIEKEILKGHIDANTVNQKVCDTLTTSQKIECMKIIQESDEREFYKNAIANNNAMSCLKIKNIELQNTCNDTIQLKRAIDTQNKLLCDEIRDTSKKEYCNTQLAKIDDIALYKTSIASNNIEKCDDITTVNLKNKCKDTIIINSVRATGDTTLCDNLTNTGIINTCKTIGQ